MQEPKQHFLSTLSFLLLLLVSFHLPISTSAKCNAEDKKALVNLKFYFGTTDLALSTWTWPFDCCDWYGVGCDNDGRVISLNLQLNPVVTITRTFEIPSSIEDLTMLKSLKLSVLLGSFVGPIPRGIAHLYDLERLDLSGNRLTGSIPGFMGQLEALKYLDLSNNQLSGQIPQTLGFLTLLTTLNLGSNQLVGPIPNNTGQILSLETIDLSSNKLTGRIPATLGRLTKLSKLDLHNNKLNGTIPEELGNAPLKTLDLSGNQLCGPIPYALSNFQVQSFRNNKCLCNKPLSACRNLNIVHGEEYMIKQLLPFVE